ncbi:hypothetical protein R3P38DRAFT_1619533 [Favolaschia claudopus]|uniref:F-box domain-containing protein n=1 Tax=Favolaschia claudopus TaxID=2862362 RepID=A0AAW0AFZ2_9AGAR
MLDLPFDVQCLILTFLDRKDLKALVQTSHGLQDLATPAFLAQYNISPSEINSGSIHLPEHAAFLIPTIHRLHPIHNLTITAIPSAQPGFVSMWCLPAVLFSTFYPNFAVQVTITGGTVRNEPYVQSLDWFLETMSRGGRDPLVIVDVARGKIYTSIYRTSPPLSRWCVDFSLREAIAYYFVTFWSGLFMAIPLLFLSIGVQFINAYRVLGYLLCGCEWGKVWSQIERIAEDIEGVCGDSLSVKTVRCGGDERLTLAVFGAVPSEFLEMFIAPLPLSSAHYSAALRALELPRLASLVIKCGAGLNLTALLSFLKRHDSLEYLTLEWDALDSTSLIPQQFPSSDFVPEMTTLLSGCSKHSNTLTSPAMYIPYLLASRLDITELTITSAAQDTESLSRALDSIASSSSANPHLFHLTLDFTALPHPRSFSWLNKPCLPWRRERRINEILPMQSNIQHLTILLGSSHPRFTSMDVESLPAWLARRFPQVRAFMFRAPRSVISEAQRMELKRLIGAQFELGRLGEWEGVYFGE